MKKSGFDVFLGLILALFVCAPVCALMFGWTASVLWGWFAVPEFKPVSMQAWYGISLVFGMLCLGLKRKDADPDAGVVLTAVGESIGLVVGCLVLLAAAGITKAIVGW